MGWDKPDVYYQPEKFNLTPVAEINYTMYDYTFDFRVVWKDNEGQLYTARDSGCSCPSPFEDYTDLAMLDRVSLSELEAIVREEVKEDDWRSGDSGYSWPNDAVVEDFLRKVSSS